MFGRKVVAIEAIRALGRIAASSDDPELKDECVEAILELEESWRWGAHLSDILDKGRRRRQERRARLRDAWRQFWDRRRGK